MRQGRCRDGVTEGKVNGLAVIGTRRMVQNSFHLSMTSYLPVGAQDRMNSDDPFST